MRRRPSPAVHPSCCDTREMPLSGAPGAAFRVHVIEREHGNRLPPVAPSSVPLDSLIPEEGWARAGCHVRSTDRGKGPVCPYRSADRPGRRVQHGADRRDTPAEGGRMNLFRTKSVEQSIADTEEPEHQLRRELSALDLTVFGIGVVIGTGIFVLTGKAAGVQAGPAVAISFVVAGIVCGLAAVCYAEFASTVPVAGSAYTFSYATLGEMVAWIIGWDLVLELALGAATVSVGWSGYFNQLLGDL